MAGNATLGPDRFGDVQVASEWDAAHVPSAARVLAAGRIQLGGLGLPAYRRHVGAGADGQTMKMDGTCLLVLAAGGHVMATVPNFYRIESSTYDLRGYNQILTTPLDNSGGRLRLPSGPGLGLDFDVDHLRANARDGFHG